MMQTKAIKVLYRVGLFVLLLSLHSLFAKDRIFRLHDSTLIGANELASDLKDCDIIFVGELHGEKQHHVNQLKIIQTIHEADVPAAIGLEMFQQKDQEYLDLWIAGDLSLEAFRNFYEHKWALPWPLYRDIFIYARDNKIPMFGINVSREIINRVSQKGLEALAPEERMKYPGVDAEIDPKYREFIRKAYRVHDYKEESFNNFCVAQVLWDVAMSGNLLQHKEQYPDRTIVSIVGDSHAWKPGIPSQIAKRSELAAKVILPNSGILNMKNATTDDTDYLWLEEWQGEDIPVSDIKECAGSTVLFDQGHGQLFVVEGNAPLDLTGLSWVFQKSGMRIKVTKQELGADLLASVDVLLISGPFKPFSTREIAAITQFVNEGGRLCVMLHVPFPLASLLHQIKVASSNGVISERKNVIGESPQNFRVDCLEPHPLTEGLKTFNVYGAWAVTNIRGNAEVIAATSPSSWVDLNRDRKLGPRDAVQSLGIMVAGEYGQGRFVVFGDDAIFQNQFLTGENLSLAVNLVRWLCKNPNVSE